MRSIAWSLVFTANMAIAAHAQTAALGTCETAAGQDAIKACTTLIDSGKLAGRELANAFFTRAVAYFEIKQLAKAEEDGDHGVALTRGRTIADSYADVRMNESTSEHRYWCQVQFMANSLAVGECTFLIDSGKFKGKQLAALLRSRAEHHKDMGLFQDAIADIDHADALDPDDKMTYYFRAGAHCRLGQYRIAITEFDWLIKRYGMEAYALFARGQAKQKIGDKVGGDADVEKARELDHSLNDGVESECGLPDFFSPLAKKLPSKTNSVH